jgi:hypothetical protein
MGALDRLAPLLAEPVQKSASGKLGIRNTPTGQPIANPPADAVFEIPDLIHSHDRDPTFSAL